MPWSSHSIRNKFQIMVNQVVEFHDLFGKKKNQNEFGKLRVAFEAGLEFIYADEVPRGAEQIVSSISTGILQTLQTIGSKKSGGEDNSDFIKKLTNIVRESTLFSHACEVELAQKEQAHKKDKIEVDDEETIISIVPINRALTDLDTQEELEQKIRSLGGLPTQSVTCFSIFKSAANYYPKTMAASALSTTMGLGYAGLTTLSNFVGNPLDVLIHADQTGLTHQAVIAATLILGGAALAAVALSKTSINTADKDDLDHDVANERTLFVQQRM